MRIDDERLAFVTITAIDVDNELNRAVVYFDSLSGEEGDAAVRGRPRRASPAHPVVDQPADAGEEDTGARLPPGRGDPRRRAHRGHPARRPVPRGVMARRRRPAQVHGLAIVDKPAGVTSHDVVGMLRRRFDERRIGHAGTLDPGATGVLVVGVGMVDPAVAVRRRRPQALHRRGRARRGDRHARRRRRRSSPLTRWARCPSPRPSGSPRPTSPARSPRSRRWSPRVRVGGRRLHELARQGIVVEREARPVTVHSLRGRGDRRSGRAGDRRRVLGRDLRADAGRRPRWPPGGRRPPAQPPPHGGRAVHHRRGPAARCGRSCSTRSRPCGRCRPWWSTTTPCALIANGRVLPAPDGDGPWAMVDGRGRLLAVYEAFGARRGQTARCVLAT